MFAFSLAVAKCANFAAQKIKFRLPTLDFPPRKR
jgi:hypothetical protein